MVWRLDGHRRMQMLVERENAGIFGAGGGIGRATHG
jgi:hypothetical protein